MKFLHKDPEAIKDHHDLAYPADRKSACTVLINLQKGFCAYSERYLKPLDSVEVEHFDPRLKGTVADGIRNWHAVIRWMNAHKSRRIHDFEPLPDLGQWTSNRVRYERGCFTCDETDGETRNLIEFIGVNKPEVFEERANHVARIRRVGILCGNIESLHELLSESPEDLSFPTALEAELGIPAFELIERVSAQS